MLTLDTASQSSAEFAKKKTVFSVCLLAASPTRMIGKVNTDTTEQVAAKTPYFSADGGSDLFF